MNEQSAHDQLSAYLDDELSPQERTVVESLLAESAAARQELAELRQVRELLIALPPESLAETFPAEVLHACEQRMLLDDVRPASAESSQTSMSKRSRFAAWAWIGGLVASIAIVGITMTWWNPNSTMDMAMSTEREIAPQRTTAEFDELMPISRNADAEHSTVEESPDGFDNVAVRSDDPFVKSMAGEMAPGSASDSVPAEAALGMAGSSDPRPSAMKPSAMKLSASDTVPSPRSAAAPTAPFEPNLAFKDNLKTAQVGQVVRALQRRDDKVIVVELTVVDRRQGLEALQLLLARHRIPVEPSEDELERTETAAEGNPSMPTKKPTGMPNELVAVHVQAPSERLQAALAELRSAAAVAEIKQRPSISPMQLASAVNHDRYGLEQKQADGEPSDKRRAFNFPEPTKKMTRNRLPATPTNDEPAAEAESVADSADHVKREVAVVLDARQRRLTVSDEILTPNNRTSGGGLGGAAAGPAKPIESAESPTLADAGSPRQRPAPTAFRMRNEPARKQGPKVDDLKASASELSGHPVELLFVLVSQDPQPPPPPLPDDAGA